MPWSCVLYTIVLVGGMIAFTEIASGMIYDWLSRKEE